MTQIPLTDQQSSVFSFIESTVRLIGTAPTCREICRHFGFSSPKSASDHLTALEKKGYIQRKGKSARGIRIVRPLGIPLFGLIPAGFPQDIEPSIDYLPFDSAEFSIPNREKAFALHVSGDSMEGRGILDGDIVVLESGAEPSHEDIVAALIDNESTLKTFIRKDGEVWLRAENPRYPDLVPAADLQIQGVARSVIRHLRRK